MNKLAVLGVFVAGMWFCSGDQSAQAQSATDKLGRGLANTFLGVFEVPNQVINTYRENTGKYTANRDRATVKAISVGTVKGFAKEFDAQAMGFGILSHSSVLARAETISNRGSNLSTLRKHTIINRII
ncbi:MAG: hypothetical protein IPI28_10505 [Candidatus Omnitrophica bacterium]|nr:hypothetical protein [Candidatus Omnitrophota bacterium]